jgi:hypothetical protein
MFHIKAVEKNETSILYPMNLPVRFTQEILWQVKKKDAVHMFPALYVGKLSNGSEYCFKIYVQESKHKNRKSYSAADHLTSVA